MKSNKSIVAALRCLAARAACVVALVFAPLAAAQAKLLVLRYGEAYSALQSIYSLPILTAQRQGFFLRQGLDFQMVLVRGGGGKMIDALNDGQADLAHIATTFLVSRVMAGSDAVAIAAEFANPIYSLIAKPSISSFAQLKGSTIGMADERGSIAYSMWKLMAQHGVRREDLRTVTIPGTPERLACLKKGACDAVPLGQPEDFLAMDAGYRRLGLSTDATPAFVYTVTAARRSWAKAHADLVIRYLRALASAFAYIRDPANRGALVRIISATEGGSEKSARETLALYFDPDRHVLPLRGEIDPAGMRQVLDFMTQTGALKTPAPPASRFMDLDYLRAAQR